MQIRAGADVRATDNFGRTPLLDASRGGHASVRAALLAAGGDLNGGGCALAPQGPGPAVALTMSAQSADQVAASRASFRRVCARAALLAFLSGDSGIGKLSSRTGSQSSCAVSQVGGTFL